MHGILVREGVGGGGGRYVFLGISRMGVERLDFVLFRGGLD